MVLRELFHVLLKIASRPIGVAAAGDFASGFAFPRRVASRTISAPGKELARRQRAIQYPVFRAKSRLRCVIFSADFTKKQRNFYGRNNDSVPFWIGVEAWGSGGRQGNRITPENGRFCTKITQNRPINLLKLFLPHFRRIQSGKVSKLCIVLPQNHAFWD